MLPIKSLLTPEEIKKLASRSHYRYGEQMSEDANITWTKENNFNIHATVKQGNKAGHDVELMSTTKGFRYKCTCTNKKDLFCEHCTAVAIAWNNKNNKDTNES